jgi:hypothetical protein
VIRGPVHDPSKRPGTWAGPVRTLRATGGPARWPGGSWAAPSACGPVAVRSDGPVGPVVARRFGLLIFFRNWPVKFFLK